MCVCECECTTCRPSRTRDLLLLDLRFFDIEKMLPTRLLCLQSSAPSAWIVHWLLEAPTTPWKISTYVSARKFPVSRRVAQKSMVVDEVLLPKAGYHDVHDRSFFWCNERCYHANIVIWELCTTLFANIRHGQPAALSFRCTLDRMGTPQLCQVLFSSTGVGFSCASALLGKGRPDSVLDHSHTSSTLYPTPPSLCRPCPIQPRECPNFRGLRSHIRLAQASSLRR